MLFLPFLVAGFVLLLIFNRSETRLCRWREYRSAETARWTCVACGATVHDRPGVAPKTCHRQDAA